MSVTRTTPRRGGHIRHPHLDLLLELFDILREPGRRYTQEEIAAFCGCSRGYIYLLEKRAMEKLRAAAGRGAAR